MRLQSVSIENHYAPSSHFRVHHEGHANALPSWRHHQDSVRTEVPPSIQQRCQLYGSDDSVAFIFVYNTIYKMEIECFGSFFLLTYSGASFYAAAILVILPVTAVHRLICSRVCI